MVLYGDGLAFIPSFARHQHVNPRESTSNLPAPDIDSRVGTRHPRVGTRANLDVDAQVGREGKGREGEGTRVDDDTSGSGEPPPPLDDQLPEKQKQEDTQTSNVTIAGAVCIALKSVGMSGVNPGNQNLKNLIEAGADLGVFVEVGRECVRQQKPFSYLLAVVKGRMTDSQVMADQAIAKAQPTNGILPGAI